MKDFCECCENNDQESENYIFRSAMVTQKGGLHVISKGGILIPRFKAKIEFKCMTCNCTWIQECSKKEYQELVERSQRISK